VSRHFFDPALDAVPDDRVPHLAAHRDPEAGPTREPSRSGSAQREQKEVRACDAPTALLDRKILRPPAHARTSWQCVAIAGSGHPTSWRP
jgi:hypothetical protein